MLLSAFVSRDFSFAYVAANSDSTLSTFYRIAGFWAGQQGSLLLWLLMLSIVTVVIALRNVESIDRLTAGAVGVLAAVAAFLAVLMVADQGSNPFVAAGAVSPDKASTRSCCTPRWCSTRRPCSRRTPLSRCRSPSPPRRCCGRERARVGAGLPGLDRGRLGAAHLGSAWVRGGPTSCSWGGYWGWDPVENTSLIPWLTATALLHSMNLYRRRGLFKRWTLALACATFWLALLATWTTRTGLIASVHAFERNDTLIAILTALLVVVAVSSVSLLAWRWRSFGSAAQGAAQGAARPQGAAEVAPQGAPFGSRDVLHALTNVALCACAAALLLATVAVPLVLDRTVTPAAYPLFAQPLGVVVVAALALCPLLGRARASAHLWRALRVPCSSRSSPCLCCLPPATGARASLA